MMSTWSREWKFETIFSSPAFKHLVDSCLHLVCQGDDWGRATWLREWKYSSQPHIMARSKVGKVFTERLRRWARPLPVMSRDHLCALWVDPPFLSLLPSSSSHSNTIGDRVVKVQTMQSMSILHFPWTLPFFLSILLASTAVLSTVQLVKGWWRSQQRSQTSILHLLQEQTYWDQRRALDPAIFFYCNAVYISVSCAGGKKVDRCVARYFLVLKSILYPLTYATPPYLVVLFWK